MNTFWPVSGWMMAYWSNKKTLCNLIKGLNIAHHHIHFKIPGDPCDLIGSQQCDLFSIHTKQPISFLISNQTSTVHFFKFGNLCMISDQIAPHSVQLPSKIISTNPLPYNFINILKHIYLLDFSCLPQLVLLAKKKTLNHQLTRYGIFKLNN